MYAVVFDIDGVIRDVSQSYRRALADTVEEFTGRLLPRSWRPTNFDIDELKREGLWNNDWEGSREFVYRAWEQQGGDRADLAIDYGELVGFFQSRYRGRGNRPEEWEGYINDEPLLVSADYFASLDRGRVHWGFFSGATRGSAHYVLTRRLQLPEPILYAMEDGPEKPDPAGLFWVVQQLEARVRKRFDGVAYCGDTSSDMAALATARDRQPDRHWRSVGIVPPHLWGEGDRQAEFERMLFERGADIVLSRATELTPQQINDLFA
ncbi:TIGR01548 family HAD-type hydrolase [Synechococcus sp. PCC 7336]|uniref:TIGR01548 family HAD-type hydrolase n=1 Tax=Synechococcus sp. PCC 7336 TaxID=195250 RepID=UPI000346E3FA